MLNLDFVLRPFFDDVYSQLFDNLDASVAPIPTPFATLSVPASMLVVKTHLTQSCIMTPNVPAV